MAYPEAQSVSGLTLNLGGEISSGNGLELDLGYDLEAFASRVAHFEAQGHGMPEHTLSFVTQPVLYELSMAETEEQLQEAAARFADQVAVTVGLMAENRHSQGDLEAQNRLLEQWWGQVAKFVHNTPQEDVIRGRLSEFGLEFPNDISRGW